MSVKIEKVVEGFELLEGPHWDVETQSLYFVDMHEKSINKYVPSTKKHTKAIIEADRVSFVIPIHGTVDKFAVGLGTQIAVVTWDGIGKEVSEIKKIAEIDSNLNTKFNDGKADPSGRIWTGTMGNSDEFGVIEPDMGILYSIDSDGSLKNHVDKIHVSNGLVWNAELKKFYYIDTLSTKIDQFDFDNETGSISNRQTIFTLENHDFDGYPDGQTIDSDGNLWIAIFNLGKIIKIDPRQPETLLDTIEIPAKQVTSVAFGGPELNELYVTTARITSMGLRLSASVNGAVYKITGLGVTGLPGVKAKII